MHVNLFNFYEDLNTVLQCPIQILENESLAILGTWDAKPGRVRGLVCRAVSDISQSLMVTIMKGGLVVVPVWNGSLNCRAFLPP